ncbi:CurL C-terminal domain-containing protein, partial [Streptomyces barringtoniae]|uniref:CurL C-terminal domain-containing protein n=1 Tax=Streptomyces barringtoniae TaxID=2892029 RepID=UPI003FD6E34B
MVVEQAPVEEGLEPGSGPGSVGEPGLVAGGGCVVWALSGRSAAALREQAGRLLAWVDAHEGVRAVDVGVSLAVGRAGLEHRAVVV